MSDLTELTNDYAIRKEMVNKGYNEIKKNGSNNIVEQIIGLI